VLTPLRHRKAAIIKKEDLVNVEDANLTITNLSLAYFERTIGQVAGGVQARALWASFRAISAIGNVIVFTFTAARGTCFTERELEVTRFGFGLTWNHSQARDR